MQFNKYSYIIFLILISFSFIHKAEAFVVYDPTNWVQNAATAANTARQLANQARELKIALEEIKNYDGNTGEWANILSLLDQLGNNVQQGQAVAYNMQNLDKEFQNKYPGYVATQNYQQSYHVWSQTTLDTLRGTLNSVGLQSHQFSNEQTRIDELSRLSKTAQGRMQAAQVGNMVATQQVAQTQQLRQLVIAQVNAQNAYAAYQVQKDSSAEATTASWINAGDTQFPPYGKGQGFGSTNFPKLQ